MSIGTDYMERMRRITDNLTTTFEAGNFRTVLKDIADAFPNWEALLEDKLLDPRILLIKMVSDIHLNGWDAFAKYEQYIDDLLRYKHNGIAGFILFLQGCHKYNITLSQAAIEVVVETQPRQSRTHVRELIELYFSC